MRLTQRYVAAKPVVGQVSDLTPRREKWSGQRPDLLAPTPLRWATLSQRAQRAFTLAEVLAAMLVMAIVIPVAMQGMSIASRAGIAGQRKAAAMRIAERVLNEQYVTGQLSQTTGSGTVVEG